MLVGGDGGVGLLGYFWIDVIQFCYVEVVGVGCVVFGGVVFWVGYYGFCLLIVEVGWW